MIDKELLIKEVKRELARRSYIDYLELSHEGRFKKGKLHEYLANKIQSFIEKKTLNAYDILILSVPPQHGKSMTITESLPSWYLGKHPEKRIIVAGYNQDFADRFSKKNQEKINKFGKVLFGISLGDTTTQQKFNLSNKLGEMISRGIQSGITGNPADLVIIDDPIKNRQEADSKTYRQKNKNEWNDSIRSRLSAGAKVIVIQTRWHKDDLAGYLIETEPNVEVVNIPLEAKENDVLKRKVGEPLAPELGKDAVWLESFKKAFLTKEGTRTWYALYQGEPVIDGGNIFKSEWFKRYDKTPEFAYKTISVDATFKDKENNDFVAIQVWGKRNEDYYFVERTKERLDFPKTLSKIEEIINRHKDYNSVIIEDKANGPAIISMLTQRFSGILPIQPEGGKEARANAVAPIVESGHVHIPYEKNQPWVHDYLVEMQEFPNSEHDDEVDSTTQALNHLKGINADYYDEETLEKMKYQEESYNKEMRELTFEDYDEEEDEWNY